MPRLDGILETAIHTEKYGAFAWFLRRRPRSWNRSITMTG